MSDVIERSYKYARNNHILVNYEIPDYTVETVLKTVETPELFSKLIHHSIIRDHRYHLYFSERCESFDDRTLELFLSFISFRTNKKICIHIPYNNQELLEYFEAMDETLLGCLKIIREKPGATTSYLECEFPVDHKGQHVRKTITVALEDHQNYITRERFDKIDVSKTS